MIAAEHTVSYLLPITLTLFACSVVTYVLLKRLLTVANKRITASFEKGYRLGVCEGLVWPHSTAAYGHPDLMEQVDQSTARHFVSVLNEAFEKDPAAVSHLFEYKVPVDKSMLAHASIPVATGADELTLSSIGIVNGLLPVIRNRYRVASIYNREGVLIGFGAYDIEKGKFIDEHASA